MKCRYCKSKATKEQVGFQICSDSTCGIKASIEYAEKKDEPKLDYNLPEGWEEMFGFGKEHNKGYK